MNSCSLATHFFAKLQNILLNCKYKAIERSENANIKNNLLIQKVGTLFASLRGKGCESFAVKKGYWRLKNMNWQWKDVLEPIDLLVNSQMTVKEVSEHFRDNAQIALVCDHATNEIIGYVTPNALLQQLCSEGGNEQRIEPLTDFLFVHEKQQAKVIHNCSLVVGADNKHQPTGFLLMSDLQAKLNELQLNHYIDALNHAEMGIVVLNKEFSVQFMNEKAEQILGLQQSVLLGRDYRKIIRMEHTFDEVLQGQKWFGIENEFNYKTITGQFSPVYDEQENVIGLIHTFYLKDTLEKAVTQISFVQEMNEYLQAFYEMTNEQIVIIDPSGNIEKITGAFLRELWNDEHAENLIGKNIFSLDGDYIFLHKLISTCSKEKRKVMMTHKQRNQDTLLLTATPIINEQQTKKYIVLIKNISAEHAQLSDVKQTSNMNHFDRSFIYRSQKISDLFEDLEAVAPLDSTVMIYGESGVGKEVIARKIHSLSKRKNNKFVAVNCGAIPAHLIESELFGHEKGAFTGAEHTRIGLFEQANEGTIFLDEIAELPLDLQVKLLRVLQEREITRIDSNKAIPVNVRVIAATNKDLQQMVREHTFREDLYYRLHVVPLTIPPLRERKEDIAPLVIHFLQKFNEKFGNTKTIATDAVHLLESYSWPGNVRELQNVIERLHIITHSNEITAQEVYDVLWSQDEQHANWKLTIHGIMPLKEAIEETEKQLIQLALKTYKTATEAAKALDVSISTVSRRMRKYNTTGGEINDLFL